MFRPLLPYRSRLSIWLIVPATVLAGAYAMAYPSPGDRGYWLGGTAAAAIHLLFSASVAAVGGAWEGHRFRASSLATIPLGRGRLQVVIGLLAAPVVCGWSVQGIAVLVSTSTSWGTPGAPALPLLAAYAAIIVFHAAVRFLLGRFLPRIASVPSALLFSYCWLGFSWSTSYLPLRYLAGLIFDSCCTVETALDMRAVWIVIGFSVAGTAAFLMVALWRRIAFLPAFGTSVVLATAVVVALSAANPLGATPVVPRAVSELRCEGGRPKICLYPEQARSDTASTTIHRMWNDLAASGFDPPPRVTASVSAGTRSNLSVVVGVAASSETLVHGFTSAFFDPRVAAYCSSIEDYERRLGLADAASRWLIDHSAAGVTSPTRVTSVTGSRERSDLVRRLEVLPESAQVAWVRGVIPALTSCRQSPLDVPVA